MSAQPHDSPLVRIWSQGDYHKLAGEHQIASERLVAHAAVRAGQRVLDVACGTGNTAIAAARRRAQVTAIDIVPALLERARVRTAAEGLEGIDYELGDATALPYADASFDAALSTFGVSFFLDHQKAIDDLLRVTRRGGVIGLTLWAEASMPTEFYHLGRDFNATPEGKDVVPAYALANGDYLRRLFDGRAASIRVLQGQYESCHHSVAHFIDAHVTYHGPAIARMEKLDDAQRRSYRARMAEVLARYNRATDGSFACSMDYVDVIAIKS